MLTADELAHIAAQLADRVRSFDAERNAIWLLATVPDPNDRWRLHFAQAALTPIDHPVVELLAWRHGTRGAAARHEARGEKWCAECVAWANEPVSTGISTRGAA
jgi:hypothetical protein